MADLRKDPEAQSLASAQKNRVFILTVQSPKTPLGVFTAALVSVVSVFSMRFAKVEQSPVNMERREEETATTGRQKELTVARLENLKCLTLNELRTESKSM